jgi:hypothetical protein
MKSRTGQGERQEAVHYVRGNEQGTLTPVTGPKLGGSATTGSVSWHPLENALLERRLAGLPGASIPLWSCSRVAVCLSLELAQASSLHPPRNTSESRVKLECARHRVNPVWRVRTRLDSEPCGRRHRLSAYDRQGPNRPDDNPPQLPRLGGACPAHSCLRQRPMGQNRLGAELRRLSEQPMWNSF